MPDKGQLPIIDREYGFDAAQAAYDRAAAGAFGKVVARLVDQGPSD